jgi:hypothetical protein
MSEVMTTVTALAVISSAMSIVLETKSSAMPLAVTWTAASVAKT